MGLHTVRVSGAPRERGRQYGEALRSAIHERDARWKEHLATHSGIAPEDFIAAHLASSHYLPAVAAWTPDLLEEVDGLAEGANLSFEHAFAAQLMDEEWLFWEEFRGRHHCSSLGTSAPGRGFAVAAQNMDLPEWMNGSQTVLMWKDPDSGIESIMLTSAGMIGLTGMNSAGLAVAVNTLSQLPSSNRGLPVAFVTRGLLAKRDVEAARALVSAVPHAAGQNYILTGVDSCEDHECSAEGTTRFQPPQAAPGAVWHTNHPLAGGHIVHSEELAATGGPANSHVRMDALNARMGPTGGAFDMTVVKTALASQDSPDYPISRPFSASTGDHGFTFASVIWELAPERRAHVAPGPPHATAYQTFDFRAGQALRAAE